MSEQFSGNFGCDEIEVPSRYREGTPSMRRVACLDRSRSAKWKKTMRGEIRKGRLHAEDSLVPDIDFCDELSLDVDSEVLEGLVGERGNLVAALSNSEEDRGRILDKIDDVNEQIESLQMQLAAIFEAEEVIDEMGEELACCVPVELPVSARVSSASDQAVIYKNAVKSIMAGDQDPKSLVEAMDKLKAKKERLVAILSTKDGKGRENRSNVLSQIDGVSSQIVSIRKQVAAIHKMAYMEYKRRLKLLRRLRRKANKVTGMSTRGAKNRARIRDRFSIIERKMWEEAAVEVQRRADQMIATMSGIN